jgi:hypothetical protein
MKSVNKAHPPDSLFFGPCESPRYPIDKTSINFNLTKTEQIPKLGRAALLSLVEWINKYRDRSTSVESHGVGENSQRKSLTLDQSVRANSIEEIKNASKTGGNN